MVSSTTATLGWNLSCLPLSCFEWWEETKAQLSPQLHCKASTQLVSVDGLGLGLLSASATSRGEPNQRDHSVPSQLCLIQSLLTSPLPPLQEAVENLNLTASIPLPQVPQVSLGA